MKIKLNMEAKPNKKQLFNLATNLDALTQDEKQSIVGGNIQNVLLYSALLVIPTIACAFLGEKIRLHYGNNEQIHLDPSLVEKRVNDRVKEISTRELSIVKSHIEKRIDRGLSLAGNVIAGGIKDKHGNFNDPNKKETYIPHMAGELTRIENTYPNNKLEKYTELLCAALGADAPSELEAVIGYTEFIKNAVKGDVEIQIKEELAATSKAKNTSSKTYKGYAIGGLLGFFLGGGLVTVIAKKANG